MLTQTLLVNTRLRAGFTLPDCPWLANAKVPGHGQLPAHYEMTPASEVSVDSRAARTA
jgi:hypothetical protein